MLVTETQTRTQLKRTPTTNHQPHRPITTSQNHQTSSRRSLQCCHAVYQATKLPLPTPNNHTRKIRRSSKGESTRAPLFPLPEAMHCMYKYVACDTRPRPPNQRRPSDLEGAGGRRFRASGAAALFPRAWRRGSRARLGSPGLAVKISQARRGRGRRRREFLDGTKDHRGPQDARGLRGGGALSPALRSGPRWRSPGQWGPPTLRSACEGKEK